MKYSDRVAQQKRKQIEGNKLIIESEFMEDDRRVLWIINGAGYDRLRFHASWQWLIPAWSKFIKSKQGVITASTLHTFHAAVDFGDVRLAFDVFVAAIKTYSLKTTPSTKTLI